MINSRFFNDADYDGIVLNIDSGFIATNPELKIALNLFTESLEACKYSTMMPSYSRNLRELKNYEEKKQLKLKADKIYQDCQEKLEVELNLKLEHKVLPIIKDFVTSTSPNDILKILGNDFINIYTKKGFSIKAEVKNAFNDFLKNSDRAMFLDFCKENNFYIDRNSITPIFNHKESSLYINSYGYPTIKIRINRVEFYKRGKRSADKIYCYTPALNWDAKENEYYIQGDYSPYIESIYKERDGETSSRMYLYDFEISKNKFIIKQK